MRDPDEQFLVELGGAPPGARSATPGRDCERRHARGGAQERAFVAEPGLAGRARARARRHADNRGGIARVSGDGRGATGGAAFLETADVTFVADPSRIYRMRSTALAERVVAALAPSATNGGGWAEREGPRRQ